MIYPFKGGPASNVPNPQRMFDFVSRTPEATHMITFLFSPWGIPATYRNPIQATNVGYATQDLYEAIERGEYPELDFDSLDDTKHGWKISSHGYLKRWF